METGELNIFVFKDGKFSINTKAAVYFFQTFGIPPDTFQDYVNEKMPPKSHIRAYHQCIAYDAAKGTNYAKKYKEIYAEA